MPLDPIGNNISDQDFLDIKSAGSSGRSGGGGPGPGGGFTAFAGGGMYDAFSGGSPFGQASFVNPLLRKKRMSMRGGAEVNDRAPSDTVPAWLTPGEYVNNDVSSALFGPQLERMNAIGNAIKMSMGGRVPESANGYASGGSVSCPCCGMEHNPFDEAEGHSLGGIVGGIGKAIGGASKWVKDHPWAIPAAVALPFAVPAAAGALGAGAGGAAAAESVAGSGALGLGTIPGGAATAASAPAAGFAAVPATAHSALAGTHPFLNSALGAAKEYGPEALKYGMDMRAQGQAADAARRQAAMEYYLQSARGYAFGGLVNNTPWARNLFGNRQTGAQAPQQGGMTAGGWSPGVWDNPDYRQGQNGVNRGGNGLNYDRYGNPTSYDPNNPWAHRSQNYNPGAIGDLNRQIGAYGQQGYFDPGGSQAVAGAMRDRAMADARAFGTQAYLGADVGGLDPAAAAAYRTQALSNAGRGVGDAMTRYQADLAMQQQQRAWGLMDTSIGNELDYWKRLQDYERAKSLGGRH